VFDVFKHSPKIEIPFHLEKDMLILHVLFPKNDSL
jgi:hypothetical protein